MAGNCWKWLEMAGNAGNFRKFLEIAINMAENGLILLEKAVFCWKWLEMNGNDWDLLEIP